MKYLVILFIFINAIVYGHPPYERNIGSIRTPNDLIEIREGYIDGIIFSDPIRFSAYSGTNLIASSEYEWNTSIVSYKQDTFYTYQYQSPLNLFASGVFKFDATGLQKINSLGHQIISPLIWLQTRPFSYVIFGLLISLPFVHSIRNRPWKKRGWSAFGGWLAVLFLTGFSLCMALISIAYFPCSIWITLTLAVIIVVSFKILTKRSNQRLDPIVTTPVDEVEPQSTQGHP